VIYFFGLERNENISNLRPSKLKEVETMFTKLESIPKPKPERFLKSNMKGNVHY